MLADTSDILALGAALRRHADDLAAAAAGLAAAQAATDAFGSVGAAFVTALNEALTRESGHAEQLAARLATATSDAGATAAGYRAADDHVGQSLSTGA